MRADDDLVGEVDHPALGAVDVGLRRDVDPALVAPELRGVHGRDERPPDRVREALGRGGDEPVVAVDDVEVVLGGERAAGLEEIDVELPDPGDELGELDGVGRLRHAVDDDAVALLPHEPRLVPPGEDVDLDAVAHELLGELARVTGESALHDRRVLPGEDEDARRHDRDS